MSFKHAYVKVLTCESSKYCDISSLFVQFMECGPDEWHLTHATTDYLLMSQFEVSTLWPCTLHNPFCSCLLEILSEMKQFDGLGAKLL